jgi:hypothetical protein
MRARTLPLFLAAAVFASACDKDTASTNPDEGTNDLIDPVATAKVEDSGEAFDLSAVEVTITELEPLPAVQAPVEKCTGKGKKRTCQMVDPSPDVSAAHGVRTLMGDYRWGMTPPQVMKLLSREIDKEYEEKQKAATGATEQDANRRWRDEQYTALLGNRVPFTKASNHKWGVSLIQYEYADDENEEMVWVRSTPTLKKYFFFKDGELWKIFYAYSTETWPGEDYAKVLDTKFRKWFGMSQQDIVKQDPETAAPILRYSQWKAKDGEMIRSFDLTAVHGVIGLAVVDGRSESRIGERLPNMPRKEGFDDKVGDVLGGGDVCYNKDGEIEECKKGEEG